MTYELDGGRTFRFLLLATTFLGRASEPFPQVEKVAPPQEKVAPAPWSAHW